jgi:sec-independent protein translocase protein TatC
LRQHYDGELSRRLNRELITRSFGELIPERRTALVPITVWRSASEQSQSLSAAEPFMIWVKAGVVTGLIISSPWIFFQLWTFVAAGLYPYEQKYVYFILPFSLGLFLAGASLAFFFVFKPVLDFLFSFNARMGISPQPRINDWLSFVLLLPLGFGVAFQLPLVMLIVNRLGLVSIEMMLGKWRIAVMIIFFLSMVLTPADPVSMVMLAVPLTGLYFLGVGLCQWLNKPPPPTEYEPV